MSQPPSGRPSRSGMSWRWTDVVRSLVVLLAIIGAIALYQAVWTDDPTPPNQPVEYAAAAEAARDGANYPVLAPPNLPDGWRATSVRYTRGERWSWHLGVLTSDEEYVGLEQAPVDVQTLVSEAAEGTEPVGSVQIDDTEWQLRRDDSRGETTFVRRSDGVTTLVTGSASQDVLESYVQSLRPA